MKVDIQDVLFWMDAIRNSNDRYRTLESFWKGQINSKLWLIDELRKHTSLDSNNIVICGGWNGILANLLFNSDISIKKIYSLDIDPICEKIAQTVNKRQEIEGRFQAITSDMCNFDYNFDVDIIINTSCEHITQHQYEQWLDKIQSSTKIVIQSNDYFDLKEHIRCAKDLDDFANMSKIKSFYKGTFETPKYNRFMIMGEKNDNKLIKEL